jgi:hypothetical protein
MEVVGPEMAVPGRHLESRMTEHSAQAVEIAAALDPPRGEGVSEIVPAEVLDARSPTRTDERLTRIADSIATRPMK